MPGLDSQKVNSENVEIKAHVTGSDSLRPEGDAGQGGVHGEAPGAAERARSSDPLVMSDRRRAAILSIIDDAIISLNEDLCITFFNRGAEHLFGYRPEEVLGRPVEFLVSQRFRLSYRSHIEEFAGPTDTARKMRPRREVWAVRKDGTEFPVEESISKLDIEGERVLTVMFRDVSERKRNEDALAMQALTFENIYDGVIVTDMEGRIIEWNPAAERMFGFSREEALGKTTSIIHRPEESTTLTGRILEGMTKNGRWSGELDLVNKNGVEGVCEVIVVPMYDDQGRLTGSIGVNHDITARKRAESEIRALNEQLEERVTQRTGQLQQANSKLQEEIAERERTERALRESEQRFRAVFENALDAILIVDDNARYLHANPAAGDIFGLPAEELTSKSLLDFVPEERREEALVMWRDFIRDGSMNGVFQITRPDGAVRDLEFNASANLLPGQHLSVLRDISEKKRSADELRRSRDQLEIILAGVTDGITAQELSGALVFANQAAAELLGHSTPEELLAAPLTEVTDRFEILGEDGKPLPLDRLPGRLALSGLDAPDTVICWRIKETGEERWSVVRATPVVDEQGKVQIAISIFRDITGQRSTEHMLKDRARQQATLAALGQRALAGTDLSTLSNEAVELVIETLGIEFCEILELLPGGESLVLQAGAGWREGLVGEATVSAGLGSQAGYTLLSSEPVVVEDLKSDSRFAGPPLLVDAGVVSGVTVIIHGSAGPFGILGAHTTRRRVFSEDDINFLQTVANVLGVATERMRAEEEIRQLNDNLQDAVKELEAFSYSVSHDLQAPLRAIAGYSEALVEDYGPELDETSQGYLARIKANVRNMGLLIDDLLSFSRLSRKEMVEHNVELDKLARAVFEQLRAAAPERNIALEVNLLPPARGDATMIQEVLVNLLGNAVKFTRYREEARIEIGGWVEGTYNVYFVKDNGAGFDMQYANKLFGVFQRLHTTDQFEGTGVGLAIAQRIIHRHGGRIWAQAAVDEGATFYFTLPRGQ